MVLEQRDVPDAIDQGEDHYNRAARLSSGQRFGAKGERLHRGMDDSHEKKLQRRFWYGPFDTSIGTPETHVVTEATPAGGRPFGVEVATQSCSSRAIHTRRGHPDLAGGFILDCSRSRVCGPKLGIFNLARVMIMR